MKEVILNVNCPHCSGAVSVSTEINPCSLAPDVRSKIRPVGSPFVYKISSDQIKQFIVQKAAVLCPDVKVEVAPRYCEKKRKRENEMHHSYASLRIAFSDNAIERNSDLGWYGKIGEGAGSPRIVKSLFNGLVQEYMYNKRDIEGWLKSYKNLEELEETLGMTEEYIEDLRTYSVPRRVPTNGNESWIIFASAPEKVLADMLTDVSTDKLIGRMQIQDVYKVSKDVVEFVVYVYPQDIQVQENVHVRQILLGEEKPKK